jgi:hypothetical protein
MSFEEKEQDLKRDPLLSYLSTSRVCPRRESSMADSLGGLSYIDRGILMAVNSVGRYGVHPHRSNASTLLRS